MDGIREGRAGTRPAVAEAVRAAILRGEFAPGQRLIEADLCERFGASRFAVRAALADLSAQGLVEFQRNRGARVREISLAEAIEITEVRKLLEGLEAARAVPHLQEDIRQQLIGVIPAAQHPVQEIVDDPLIAPEERPERRLVA